MTGPTTQTAFYVEMPATVFPTACLAEWKVETVKGQNQMQCFCGPNCDPYRGTLEVSLMVCRSCLYHIYVSHLIFLLRKAVVKTRQDHLFLANLDLATVCLSNEQIDPALVFVPCRAYTNN